MRGLATVEPIVMDGELHRFTVEGDRSPNGWYVLHGDGLPAGVFGCWKRQISETWHARSAGEISPAERAELERKWRDARTKRDAAAAETAATAEKARVIWDEAPPAAPDHPYLVRKGIAVAGLRQTGDRLLIPLRAICGELRSLQFIAPDGTKRFLKGGPKRAAFFTVGDVPPEGMIYLAEGLATAASVHEATGKPVIAAMDAGNLEPVATAIRRAYPGLTLIFAADHDQAGIAKATAAARRVDGSIVYPKAPGTDFNDLHQAEGLEAVRDQLQPAARRQEPHEAVARAVTLRVSPGELAELADQAEMALLEHRGDLYQRGGQLVRIRIAQTETVQGIHRHGGTPVISQVDTDYLVDQLSRLVHWEKYNERRHDWVTCDAPRAVALVLLSRAGSWKVPPLVGFITAPTLRPDGSAIERPGYDARTGLLFVDMDIDYPPIPAAPGRAAGRAALDFILDTVLSGFPFARPHHRAAALSAILTALVRHSLPATPLHAFTAPAPGSGKSLLADAVGLIATGVGATSLSFAPDPDELRKRVFSVLLAGDSVINLDNVEEPLHGAALCSVLTGETFTDRVMGASRIQTAPSICTWLATGNNLVFKGDITRRVVLCEIDPQCERPEERTFTCNLRDWIPANRPALVAAGLTALRAYVAAGTPAQPIEPMGSFEAWSGLVRAALVWLGEADPLLGRAEIESVDPIRTKLRAIVLAWYHTFKSVPATCSEAVNRAKSSCFDDDGRDAYEAPELREVLLQHFTNSRGELCSRVLGEFFKLAAKRVEAGAKIEVAGISHQATRWRVVVINRAALEQALQGFRQG
jgi:putative DNA primase/helicase